METGYEERWCPLSIFGGGKRGECPSEFSHACKCRGEINFGRCDRYNLDYIIPKRILAEKKTAEEAIRSAVTRINIAERVLDAAG
jgi:hypothetical protein